MRRIDADALKLEVSNSPLIDFTDDDIFKLIDNAPTVELFCSYMSDGEVREPCVEGPCKHERPLEEKDEDS